MDACREIFGRDEIAKVIMEGWVAQHGTKQLTFPSEGFAPGRRLYAFDEEGGF